VTPELTRCAQEERSRAGVGRASGVVDEDEGSGCFEVSEGDVADYVESVGGRAFVSSERRWKMEDEAGETNSSRKVGCVTYQESVG
jgi:hypothetical protein